MWLPRRECHGPGRRWRCLRWPGDQPGPAVPRVCDRAGRTVRLTRGSKSQTVRVRAAADKDAKYEVVYRFGIDVVVDPDELARLVDLGALGQWCTSHGDTSEVPGTSRKARQVAAPAADDPWVLDATSAVDAAVDAVVDQFLTDPYPHRVERSLHMTLWAELKARPHLQDVVLVGSGDRRTQLVHKEWPETVPGVEGDEGGPAGTSTSGSSRRGRSPRRPSTSSAKGASTPPSLLRSASTTAPSSAQGPGEAPAQPRARAVPAPPVTIAREGP